MNYINLLIKQNFIQWLEFISNSDESSDIKQSALEILYQTKGNSIIYSKPIYNSLYLKYKFKVASKVINNKNEIVLYSYDGVNQNTIGVIQGTISQDNYICCDSPPLTISPYVSQSQTPTPSNTCTPNITPTNTKTPSVTPSITRTNTITPTPSKSQKAPCVTKTPRETPTPSRTPTPTVTVTKTTTPTFSNTVTPTITPSNTVTPTTTPSNTVTPTNTNSNTPSSTISQTPFFSLSATPTPFSTPSLTSTNSSTPSPTVSPTKTSTPNPTTTQTVSPTITPTPTITSTGALPIIWATKKYLNQIGFALPQTDPLSGIETISFKAGKGDVIIQKNPLEAKNWYSSIYGYNNLNPCVVVNNPPTNYPFPTICGGMEFQTPIINFYFSKPITNPHIALYSLGSNIMGTPKTVYLRTNKPFVLLCSSVNRLGGVNANPIQLDPLFPNTQFYGSEAYGILIFPGTHTNISFTRYRGDFEFYTNFVWGAPDQ